MMHGWIGWKPWSSNSAQVYGGAIMLGAIAALIGSTIVAMVLVVLIIKQAGP